MKSLIQYILKRLLYLVPVLLGVCFLIFLIFNLYSGDPAVILLGKHATVDQIRDLREQLGLNRPLFLQYLDVVKSSFTFDFGRSWQSKQLISEIIWQGAFPSLALTVPAFLVSTVVSIMISLLVAHYRGQKIDIFVRFVCIGLVSISALVYVMVFQYFFAFKLGWFPITGFERAFPDFLYYTTLPGIIFVALSLGPDVRFYRTILLDEIYQDYVRTARAKGLKETQILFRHVLKNAMIPIITYVVIQIPFLVLGSLLLENFFGIPGLGSTVMNAINNTDFPVLKAFAVLSSVAYIIFNLITDLLYYLVDPRVKLD
jgi:peptide/nickel transport system permease protein